MPNISSATADRKNSQADNPAIHDFTRVPLDADRDVLRLPLA